MKAENKEIITMGYFECFTCGEEMEYDDEGDFECDNCNAVMSVDIEVDINLVSEGREPYLTNSFDRSKFNCSLTYWEINKITGIVYLEIPLFVDQLREWVTLNYLEGDSITTQIELFWNLHKDDWKHCYIYREKSHESLY